jgi:hypothetical protein
MEATVPGHVWTIEDIVGLLDLEPGGHKMRVRLRYEGREAAKQPSVVDMVFIPHPGDFLLSGRAGRSEVIEVVQTPGDPEQDVILELREKP